MCEPGRPGCRDHTTGRVSPGLGAVLERPFGVATQAVRRLDLLLVREILGVEARVARHADLLRVRRPVEDRLVGPQRHLLAAPFPREGIVLLAGEAVGSPLRASGPGAR